MTGRETCHVEMLRRVAGFRERHRDLFPAGTPGVREFDTVATALQQLGEQAVVHRVTAREGKQRKDAARAALEDQIRAIGRCAQLIDRDVPGFAEKFSVKRPRSDHAVLLVGRAFVRSAAGHEQRFIACAMPPDTLTHLASLVDAYALTIDTWQASGTRRVAARASLDVAFADGREAVRRLDIMMTNRFRNDAVMLASWQQDRRVGYPKAMRRRRRRRQPSTA